MKYVNNNIGDEFYLSRKRTSLKAPLVSFITITHFGEAKQELFSDLIKTEFN